MQQGTGIPVFTPITAPEITSISHEALTDWTNKRRHYESKLRARCRVTGENYDNIVQSVRDSMDPDLLDGLCELKLNKSVANVTDAMLIAEIALIPSSVKNDTLPDVKTLFKSKLRMNLTESDVGARVLDYFNQFRKLVREHGLGACFEGNGSTEAKRKQLVASLHPAALKEEVEPCLQYTHKQAASTPRLLFDLVVEKVKEHERRFLRQRSKKRDRDEDVQKKTKNPEGKKKSKIDDNTEDSSRKVAKTNNTSKTKTTSKSKSIKLPPSPCPKCSAMHWLNECPKAIDEEKLELRKRLRETNAAKRAKAKHLGELLPTPSRVVMVNGVLEIPYCADSGSDHTVMGRSHWDQLRTLDLSVQAEELDVPVRNQTFGSVLVTADKNAKLHLMIRTAVGQVELMKAVDVLIVDVDDDEFILGNDLLRMLGIDVERQLEQLADRNVDETSGDPVELEFDESPVRLEETQPEDGEVFAAVERLIDEKNGFPTDKIDRLRTIVHAYDVWRLTLQADPPAHVTPLGVRLREGARPTKCKPRRYPPHIRKFLRDFNSRLVELGLVYENLDSRWVSPVLPVKKSADLMGLRQTTDYRELNALTEVMTAVMPILSVVMENAKGMKHF